MNTDRFKNNYQLLIEFIINIVYSHLPFGISKLSLLIYFFYNITQNISKLK